MTGSQGTDDCSVKAAKTGGASPGKRGECDAAFGAEALRRAGERRRAQAAGRPPGTRPKLRPRWQQAQGVAAGGSAGVARDPGGGAGHVRKRLGHLRPAKPVERLPQQHPTGQRSPAPRPRGAPAPAASNWRRFKAELRSGGRFPGPAEAKPETSHRVPVAMPNDATRRLVANPPSTSKRTRKPHPNRVRLS